MSATRAADSTIARDGVEHEVHAFDAPRHLGGDVRQERDDRARLVRAHTAERGHRFAVERAVRAVRRRAPATAEETETDMDISDETMLRLLQSAMYGEAIGDALGVPYEGRARDTFTCITMTDASGMLRMSAPLPLSRSPSRPWSVCRAWYVVRPTPNAAPSAVYLPSNSQSR